MSKLSIHTNPKKLAIFIHRFWNSITLLEDKSEVIPFLKDLLTPTEIRMFAKRLQIADMLSKGYTYQDIRTYVNVTFQTIASVNNKLNYGENGVTRILRRLEKIDKQKQDKLEGKKDLFSPQPGIGRLAGNLASNAITKVIRHHKKIFSVESDQ